MNVYNMVFEVTRKCNLRCSHCMRGPAQRLNMSREVIFNALYHVNSIGCLTFTGGEPALAVDVIEEIIQNIIWKKVNVNCFYVITNGKNSRNRIRLLEALFKLYGICDVPDGCSLVLSDDEYHRWQRGTANKKYLDGYMVEEFGERYWKEVPFFNGCHTEGYMTNVINEGYAEINGIGTSDKKPQPKWEIYYDDSIYVSEHDVVISANGNVTSCCDMSYHRIDTEPQGNVLKESLINIIERNSIDIYENEKNIA